MPKIPRKPLKMRVLIACEHSNTVRDAFLDRGHDAWSCDLKKADHPNVNFRRHIRGDVTPLLQEPWDLIIAHPPCTYLCNSGVRWFKEYPNRQLRMLEGALFFLACLSANAPKVAVENPIMHGYAKDVIGEEPTQIIQPWMFGHGETKATCLWLKGLPPLTPTNIVEGREQRIHKLWGPKAAELRSITYKGIADAMATQWGSDA